jgi:hypothetical protein
MKLVREHLNEISRGQKSSLNIIRAGKEGIVKMISDWCDSYNIKYYTITDDLKINVWSLHLERKKIESFPDYIKFGVVGFF